MRVRCHFEDLHLPHGSFLCELVVVALLELLNSHEALVLDVTALEHHPVGPLPDC